MIKADHIQLRHGHESFSGARNQAGDKSLDAPPSDVTIRCFDQWIPPVLARIYSIKHYHLPLILTRHVVESRLDFGRSIQLRNDRFDHFLRVTTLARAIDLDSPPSLLIRILPSEQAQLFWQSHRSEQHPWSEQ